MILLFLACNTPGQIIDRVTDPDKVIHDYEWFHTAHTRIGARVAQIADTRSILADEQDPAEKRRLRVDLSGQQQSCRELVADYNANAEKLTVGIFRGWSLPANVTPSECE